MQPRLNDAPYLASPAFWWEDKICPVCERTKKATREPCCKCRCAVPDEIAIEARAEEVRRHWTASERRRRKQIKLPIYEAPSVRFVMNGHRKAATPSPQVYHGLYARDSSDRYEV